MAVLPGIFFVYDLSPFMVNVKKERIPILHLFTRLLAIVGGVFTVLGIIDSTIYKAQRMLNKKK